jgi:hypothetical protein
MTRKEVIPMGSLMPEMRPANVGSLLAQIVEKGKTGLDIGLGCA